MPSNHRSALDNLTSDPLSSAHLSPAHANLDSFCIDFLQGFSRLVSPLQVHNPSVIIVGTHSDERFAKDGNGKIASAQLEELCRGLTARNPNASVRACSTGMPNDIMTLATQIQAAVNNLPIFGRKVPFSYVFFEQLLKDHANSLEQPVIPVQTLLRLGPPPSLSPILPNVD